MNFYRSLVGLICSATLVSQFAACGGGSGGQTSMGARSVSFQAQVLDESTLAPIPDADILLTASDASELSTNADEEGNFSLTLSENLSYTAVISKAGQTASAQEFPIGSDVAAVQAKILVNFDSGTASVEITAQTPRTEASAQSDPLIDAAIPTFSPASPSKPSSSSKPTLNSSNVQVSSPNTAPTPTVQGSVENVAKAPTIEKPAGIPVDGSVTLDSNSATTSSPTETVANDSSPEASSSNSTISGDTASEDTASSGPASSAGTPSGSGKPANPSKSSHN